MGHFKYFIGLSEAFMRKLMVLTVVAVCVGACTPAQLAVARTALDALAVACVLGTQLTDESAVANACGVADDARPALREMLAGKAAAARMASSVCEPGDAGK